METSDIKNRRKTQNDKDAGDSIEINRELTVYYTVHILFVLVKMI